MKDCDERRALTLMLARAIHAVQNSERARSVGEGGFAVDKATGLLEARRAERRALDELDRHRRQHCC